MEGLKIDWRDALRRVAVSAVLPAEVSGAIDWYFRIGGIGAFSSSRTGALLARAELFSIIARPCERCGGDQVKWTGGSGFESSKKQKNPVLFKSLTGRQKEQLALIEGAMPDLPAAVGDRLCGGCYGRGWALSQKVSHSRGELTARPMGSSVKAGGGQSVMAEDASLAKLGSVSKLLDRAQEIRPGAYGDLEAFHSPGSYKGTWTALWHRTPAGKTMLHANGATLHHLLFFANERSDQESKPNDKRAAQFKAADEQSSERYRDACRACNEAMRRLGGWKFSEKGNEPAVFNDEPEERTIGEDE